MEEREPRRPAGPHRGEPRGREPQRGAPPRGEPRGREPERGEPQLGGPPQGEPHQGEPQLGGPPQGEPHQGEPHEGEPWLGGPQLDEPLRGGPHRREPQRRRIDRNRLRGHQPKRYKRSRVLYTSWSQHCRSSDTRQVGKAPVEVFAWVGLPDTLIDYLPSLLGDALEFYSCFISYSSKDQKFAERLHADLQDKGVRCWFAPEDLKIGARTRPAIDEAIRVRDKVLLILSERSIESDWVEKEVETAFEEERRRKRTVLFPIRLDNTVMDTSEAWAADIRRTRTIGDFRHWKDHDAYQKAFDRLIRDLKQEADSSKKGKAASK